MGLAAALGIASRAIQVFSTGIQVAGQNIANANTPGYIREQLDLTPALSYGVSPLILGTGVAAVGVTQQVDQFLQRQILTANSNYSASNARNTVYTNLQQQLQALGPAGLSQQVSTFSDALNSLANQPESSAVRQQAVVAGTQLATSITSLRTAVDQQRIQDNGTVNQLVAKANNLITDITRLNPQITQSESSGLELSQAGSLRDQRYQDLNDLSQIVPTSYTENADGSVNVYMGSEYLVLGGQNQQLQTVGSSSGGVGTLNVRLSVTGSQITADMKGGGQLVGVLQGRDQILGGFTQKLDNLASNLIFDFNKVYASGQGIEGVASVTSEQRVADPTAALNQAGLPFPPQNGNFQIDVTNTVTGQSSQSTIAVNLNGTGADTSLNGLAVSIGGVAHLSASVTADGHLKINADSGYQIQFANDSSDVLASLGINTFFTGTDSTTIGVDSAVKNNPNLFAAGQGGGPSDGTNALALSQFADSASPGLGGSSINDYYDSTISAIANQASAETAMSSSLNDFSSSLQSQQQQFSGVSLDQEAIQIMQFQQSYQASAKLVSTIDDLFKTLMNV